MAGSCDRHGTPAATGRALGPAYLARAPAMLSEPAGTQDAGARLSAAVAQAADQLRELARRTDTDGAELLDFQIELLLDREILAPALEHVVRGEGPALAWAVAMDRFIAALAAEPDDSFAARIADLSDLKYRVLDALAGRVSPDFPAGSVYIGADMPPSLFLAHDWSQGGAIALIAGSSASHVAMLARARGVPMVVNLGPLDLPEGRTVLVDGDEGLVRLEPDLPARSAPAAATGLALSPPLAPARQDSIAGSVRLSVNINSLSDLDTFDLATISGVGLVRTEFLFRSAAEALNEERHVTCYRQIVQHLARRPVTLRMLDLGGDKTLPGLVDENAASILGQRGIRLLLAHPELARLQARALMRAAASGPVNVLLPMVTLPEEVAAMQKIFEEEADRLSDLGIPARLPPIGMMVEVPAAALTLDLFTQAAFFSVGTNDLMQYLSAAARDNPAVASLNAGAEVALFRLLDQLCASARALGKPISICGDLAGDPARFSRLVAAGFRDFSMAPARLPAIRVLLRGDLTPADGMAEV